MADPIIFPEGTPNATHVHDGITYTWVNDHWVVIPPELDDLVDDDRFVEKKGDTMTGSLTCPLLIGNFDLTVLDDLG